MSGATLLSSRWETVDETGSVPLWPTTFSFEDA
jgi:hypothetical protein